MLGRGNIPARGAGRARSWMELWSLPGRPSVLRRGLLPGIPCSSGSCCSPKTRCVLRGFYPSSLLVAGLCVPLCPCMWAHTGGKVRQCPVLLWESCTWVKLSLKPRFIERRSTAWLLHLDRGNNSVFPWSAHYSCSASQHVAEPEIHF